MNWRKIFRRTVSILFAVSIMLFAAVSHAEIYIGEGSYCMSEGENLGVAKERAKADAMRYACEQAGVYVKSYSRERNFELEEDVIETITANIIKLVEEPHFLPYEQIDNMEGLLIRVTVKAQIDDSDITRWLNKDEQEKSTLVSQMEALRKANEEQARQIAELKRQLAAKPQDREQITKKFEAEDKIFLSNQKVADGWKLWEQKDFNGAKNLFDEAVKLNPDNAGAYYGRGTACNGLKQYEQAIKYFDKAIELKLNPNLSYAYNNRGNAYSDLGQNERAIQDYNKAIELNPNYAEAYNNRGVAYMDGLKQYERAIQDYNKAIELNPNYADAYYNRGNAYKALGQYERAIQDYNKTIELNPNFDKAYNNRGIAYNETRRNELAIQDYNKAIELNPNYANAYNNRGWAYYCMKKYEQALKDFEKALELNPNHTKAKNNREACLKAIGK
ncbi:MAG: tetratricopeptide repeat protein [Selenomonadaceae bacterium]|nr:tetratricopeptide repeat protein [Selenomonadaceae bacterium]